MAEAQNHDYHLVNPSPWPLVGSIGAGAMALGAVFFAVALRRFRKTVTLAQV